MIIIIIVGPQRKCARFTFQMRHLVNKLQTHMSVDKIIDRVKSSARAHQLKESTIKEVKKLAHAGWSAPNNKCAHNT